MNPRSIYFAGCLASLCLSIFAAAPQAAPVDSSCPLIYASGRALRHDDGVMNYPDGRLLRHWDGTLYYPNGSVLRQRDGSMLYPDGRILKLANGDMYYADGSPLRQAGQVWDKQGQPSVKIAYSFGMPRYGRLQMKIAARDEDYFLALESAGSDISISFNSRGSMSCIQ